MSSLRRARHRDLAPIRKIINSKNNRPSFGWVMEITLAAAIEAGEARMPREHLIVATERGAVVGFCRIYHRRDGQSSLHEIGVSETAQNAGIGSQLITRAIELAQKRGQEIVIVKPLTERRRSHGFYRRHGFRKIGTQPARKRELTVFRKKLR